MNWKEALTRIGGYAGAVGVTLAGQPQLAPLIISGTEAAAQGMGSNRAIDQAVGQQQAGTNEALQRVGAAQTQNGVTVNQSRQDYQNLANVPYQTLGSMLGISIPNVRPLDTSAGNMAANPHPTGPPLRHVPGAGLIENPGATNPFGMPGDPRYAREANPPTPMQNGVAPEARASLKTQSSYGSGTRRGPVRMVPYKLPTGRTIMIPDPAQRRQGA